MLDCKMTSSLSPITPINIMPDYYMGLWEQDGYHSSIKQENTEFVSFLDPSLSMTGSSSGSSSSCNPTHNNNDNNNIITSHCLPSVSSSHHLSHHENPRSSSALLDCQFQNNSYLGPLPTMGDPYHHQSNVSTSECQILETLSSCPSSNMESHQQFHKLSTEVQNPFPENYENFISDLSSDPSSQHHNQNQSMCPVTTNENLVSVSVAIHCPNSSTDLEHDIPHPSTHHHSIFQHNNHHNNGVRNNNHNNTNEASHSPLSAMSLSFDPSGIHVHNQQSSSHCGVPTSIGLLGNSSSTMLCHPDYNWDDLTSDPGDYSMFLRKGESPNNSDMVSYGDGDSELDSKSSGGSHSRLTDICQVSPPPKRKVGRPPKKDKKHKRNEKKTGRLWEFIRDLLKDPEYCPSLVRWENVEEGHFRFVNSEKVAQLWGRIKGNPRMTYEKLSRAMRYYYKSHVFESVTGRRLVYKFGHNATNWRPTNPSCPPIPKHFA